MYTKGKIMKNITNLNVTFLITVILIFGASYYVFKYIIPEDPFNFDNLYQVIIITPDNKPDEKMTITNSSQINLRLYMFNASDKVKGIERENWILKRGDSRNYKRGDYVFHVFESQLIDVPILWTDTLWTDVVFRGDEDNLEVQGGPKPPVEIKNDVDEQLRVCTYKHIDALQAVPLKCWTLSKGRTIKWNNAPPLFTLKVFKLALVGDPIITESDVEHLSKITISEK